MKIKQTNGNWGKALAEIKDFLKEYQPNVGGYPKINPIIQPGNYPVQNNSSMIFLLNRFIFCLLDGACNFKWDRNSMGSSIELSNNDMNVFLKESAYMFRTIIGDYVIKNY